MTRGCATLCADVHNTLVSVPGREPLLAYPAPATNLAIFSHPASRRVRPPHQSTTRKSGCFLRIKPRKLVGARGSCCTIGSALSEDQCASCGSIVHTCERRSSCRCYQGIADTIVQLFRLHASGVIASWQATRWDIAQRRVPAYRCHGRVKAPLFMVCRCQKLTKRNDLFSRR